MIKIDITASSSVNKEKIKRAVKSTLHSNKVDDAQVSIAVVNENKMQKYVNKFYKKDKKEHPVLAFPNHEVKSKFVFPPSTTNHLGEIILAESDDDTLAHWAAHATLHLLGIHHD